MNTNFKLKLLNGPLQGHEVRLPLGDFTFGSEDSDFLIPLECGGSAKLEVTEGGVILVSDTPCWVSGVAKDKGVLPLLTPIDLSGVHFVLANIDDPFLSVFVPKRKSNVRKFLIIPFIFLTIIVLIVSKKYFPSEKQLPKTKERELLGKYANAEPDLTIKWQSDGTVKLSGHCDNSNVVMEITERMLNYGVYSYSESICSNDLKSSIEALFRIYGYHDVRVHIDKKNNATIDGAFQSNNINLARDLDVLPGLKSWRISNSSINEIPSIISLLKKKHLLHGVSIRWTKDYWALEGSFDTEFSLKINKLIEVVNSSLDANGLTKPIRFTGPADTFRIFNYLPSPIVSVGGNSVTAYLELANGMRLLVGSPVKKGMYVIDVSPYGVSLAGRNCIVFLPLNT